MIMNKGRESKPHIGIFGRRNVGKSSFINVLTGQDVAIVSEEAGTTTDPVRKSMEIFGIGPAVIIDTAGIDDEGELGRKRIQRSLAVLKSIDMAILIITNNHFAEAEEELITAFRHWELPFIIVHNKSDLCILEGHLADKLLHLYGTEPVDFNTINGDRESLISHIINHIPGTAFKRNSLLDGLVGPGDLVLLVTPIDAEAPEGRMILPQVMAIRDVLDHDGINVVLKVDQLSKFLSESSIKPRIVITDSQAFGTVKDMVPADMPLTSFSILFARNKGEFESYLDGTPALDNLKDGDRVLILESCTHQVNCDDIGRFKIPMWLMNHSGCNLQFDAIGGLSELSRPAEDYALVIQCGGCMITRKQIQNRLKPFIEKGIPVTNYGMAIAWFNGIFDRAVAVFRPTADDIEPKSELYEKQS
jgi:[FeFe] hydrogenase H-cluster maturation GTPase HydF